MVILRSYKAKLATAPRLYPPSIAIREKVQTDKFQMIYPPDTLCDQFPISSIKAMDKHPRSTGDGLSYL